MEHLEKLRGSSTGFILDGEYCPFEKGRLSDTKEGIVVAVVGIGHHFVLQGVKF